MFSFFFDVSSAASSTCLQLLVSSFRRDHARRCGGYHWWQSVPHSQRRIVTQPSLPLESFLYSRSSVALVGSPTMCATSDDEAEKPYALIGVGASLSAITAQEVEEHGTRRRPPLRSPEFLEFAGHPAALPRRVRPASLSCPGHCWCSRQGRGLTKQ